MARRDTNAVSRTAGLRGRTNRFGERPASSRRRGTSQKSHPVLRKPKAVSFRFVEEQRGALPGDECQPPRAAGLSQPQAAQRMNMVVPAHLKEQLRLSLGSYGRPGMTEELRETSVDVGHRRVGRPMHENGTVVERTRKFQATTDSDHTSDVAPNLRDRNFTADRPNQKWAGYISYIRIREGWLYLAAILDLHSRRVIGWAVSNRMKRRRSEHREWPSPCAVRLAAASSTAPPAARTSSHDDQKDRRERGLKASMGGKGNRHDNAAIETFFKSLEAEPIWRRDWQTGREVELALFEYINGF